MTRTEGWSSVGHLNCERYVERSSTYERVGERPGTEVVGSGKGGEILLHMAAFETEDFQIFRTTSTAAAAAWCLMHRVRPVLGGGGGHGHAA